MFSLLFTTTIISMIIEAIKGAWDAGIPDENFENKELYEKDIADGLSPEQILDNLENGKYRMDKIYPEPHRNPVNGKIIIENDKLYYDDAFKYGAPQAQQWAMQGKYNLPQEER